MKKKTKILAILAVAVMMFTVMAISCFAYDVGTTITFKDTYTQEELEKYFTEYKDVEGVYYNSESSNFGNIFPDLLSMYETFSEIVCIYKGEGFSETSNAPTVPFIYLGKSSSTGAIYIYYKQNESTDYIYSGKNSVWSKNSTTIDNGPEFEYTSGTFTLTDEQFNATGLLWSFPSEKNATISEFLSSLGKGISSFLPKVAGAGVDTVDILFVTQDGSLTTVAILTIIGAVTACGLGVFAMIKKKIKKI